MATVRYDSELMTNYVSALAVPPSSHFVTCLDPVSRRPMVFAISTDAIPKLQVIKEDGDGICRLIDFGKLIGISETTPVQAFDCQQAADLTIYLCVAAKYNDNQSSVIVVSPFHMSSTPSPKTLPVHNMSTVQKILMGSPDSSREGYPPILATHQPLNKLTSGSDISRIAVDSSMTDWVKWRDMELPLNASQIIDIAPASNAYGRGLYALISIQGSTEIIGEFARPDEDQDDGSLFWYNASLKSPRGATSIETMTDRFGRSSLFVACSDGLQYFTCSEATERSATGKLISSDPLFKQATQLKVAQDQDRVTVWSISKGQELGYLRMNSNAIGMGTSVLLLPSGKASGFSASVSSPAPGTGLSRASQTLVTNDNAGNLSLLQQFADTGLWKQQPFYTASTSTNVAVKSYTISIDAFDSKGATVPGATVSIAASAFVNATCNGKPVTLNPGGSTFTFDASSELAFIIPTASMAAQTLNLSTLSDANGNDLQLEPLSIDPSRKVIEAFSGIKSGADLANAKNKDGVPLYEGVEKPSAPDLDNAGRCVANMYSAFKNLPRNGVSSTAQDIIKTGGSGLEELAMERFHYLKYTRNEAVDWVVTEAGKVWKFSCKIGDDIRTFILDTVEKIGDAFIWVWEKIKLGIDKLIEYAGFLFAWKDILATKDTFKDLCNATLDVGAAKVSGLTTRVDAFFEKIESSLGSIPTPPVAPISAGEQATSPSSGGKASQSTSVSWTGERFKNGGGMDSSKVQSKDTPANSQSDSEVDSLFDALDTATTAFANSIKTLPTDVGELFSGNSGISIADVLKKIGTGVLLGVVRGLKTAVNSILKALEGLLHFFKTTANATINIPIFSALYKDFVGSDLSVMDAVCLLVAIPATILHKLVTGAAPPRFSKVDDNLVNKLMAFGPDTEPRAQAQGSEAGPPTKSDQSQAGAKTQTEPSDSDQAKAGTFFACIKSSLLVLKPLYILFDALKAAYQSAKQKAGGAAGASQTYMPTRAIRLVGIVLHFAGLVAEALKPDPRFPATANRLVAAVFPAVDAVVATAVFVKDWGKAEQPTIWKKTKGIIDEDTKRENLYQVFSVLCSMLKFAVLCSVYDTELTTEWDYRNEKRSALGISMETLSLVAVFSNYVAYESLINDNLTAAGWAVGIAGVLELAGMVCGLTKWVLEYEAGMYPKLA